MSSRWLPKGRPYQMWFDAARKQPQEDLPSDGRSYIVVTGCPRSGTRYVACVLQYLGKDVRHEWLGRDGVSSAGVTAAASGKPFAGRSKALGRYRPRQVVEAATALLHQVRHPLAFLASASRNLEGFWRHVREIVPHDRRDPALVRAAKYWLHWNRLAERLCDWTYRVETLGEPATFEEFCRRTGVSCDRKVLDLIPTDVGSDIGPWLALEKEPVSWTDVAALDARLCERIRTKAEEYGYEI